MALIVLTVKLFPMYLLHVLSFAFLLGFFPGAHAVMKDDADDAVSDIVDAIEGGRARDVAAFFGSNVDLTTPVTEGTYSKSHAEMIVRDFFSRNTPSSFRMTHRGPMRDGSVFISGRLTTSEGKNYRCHILIKKISGEYVLHQLKFE